jgi:hypothetical protein
MMIRLESIAKHSMCSWSRNPAHDQSSRDICKRFEAALMRFRTMAARRTTAVSPYFDSALDAAWNFQDIRRQESSNSADSAMAEKQ